MKTAVKLLVAAVVCAAGVANAKITDTDWASIETPDVWDYNKDPNGFDVVVTLKEGAPIDGNWLQVHLHWMKINGYGGFSNWQPPKKKLEAGKPYKFHYKPKVEEGETHRYSFDAFLAPNANDKAKVKDQFIEIPIPPPPPYEARPDTVTFKKSYIWVEEDPKPTRVGDDVVLKVKYYLDPSDTWGPKPTKLVAMPLGPWIDNPDGVINKKRMHVSYGGGMFSKEVKVEPGEHEIEFKFKLGTAYRYNSCFFLCKFRSPDGKDWPWDWRGSGLTVVPKIDYFRMFTQYRGGLFYYGEVPTVALAWGDLASGGLVRGHAVVKDVLNNVVLEKDFDLNPAWRVQTITFPELRERGVFSVTMKVPKLCEDGSDFEDFCYFGTIPKFERVAGKSTPFCATNLSGLDMSKLAYDLGFSVVRHFTSWAGIEPAKGKWHLKGLDHRIESNHKAGLKAWIQLYGPPAWTLPPGMGKTGEFEPAPFNLDDWSNAINTLAKRYTDKLYGFEFLNEIVPGHACEDPVKTYVDICRVGYETAKKNNPNYVCQLAGGLWPHTFRIDCLNAGVGQYVDILPVHYNNYEGIREAQKDLAVRGIKNVRVADNETAQGHTIWNYPPDMAFEKSLAQCRWVMTQWPDELCAGAEFITYFGGQTDACGNWSYALDATSPRPVAATLAVVQGKLAYAKPIDKFYLGGISCHLFEKDGRAIAFLAGTDADLTKGGKTKSEMRSKGVDFETKGLAKLPYKGDITITDFQGNESVVKNGEVVTTEMPVIAEGADLDVLKLHASLFIGTGNSPTPLPQIVVDMAETMGLPVTVSNPYDKKVAFTVKADDPAWGTVAVETVELEPGAKKTFEVKFTAKKGEKIPAVNRLNCSIAANGMKIVKPFVLYVTDEASLGDLVRNGGFDGDTDGWKGEGKVVPTAVPGAPDNKCLQLNGVGNGYKHHTKRFDVPVPGGKYLYTAWVRGDGMGGGSNFDMYDADGKHLQNLMMLNVWTIPNTGTKGWNYLSKMITLRPNCTSVSVTPVAQGAEGAFIRYDNVQLSLYKGSDYVAFASSEKAKSSPIPLLCSNQLRAENGYQFDEKNCVGVASFTWTKDALVFEASVEDDVFMPKGVVTESGEETLKGDSIALCIFPRMGPDGTPENGQLRWYLSKVNPGGSGTCTVYRPKKYSMGLKSGQLCKDSSLYQVDIRTQPSTSTSNLITYRLSIPWSEIPGVAPGKGASFGCNLVLGDSDGDEKFGRFLWGGGLKDDSADCGLVTLIK